MELVCLQCGTGSPDLHSLPVLPASKDSSTRESDARGYQMYPVLTCKYLCAQCECLGKCSAAMGAVAVVCVCTYSSVDTVRCSNGYRCSGCMDIVQCMQCSSGYRCSGCMDIVQWIQCSSGYRCSGCMDIVQWVQCSSGCSAVDALHQCGTCGMSNKN